MASDGETSPVKPPAPVTQSGPRVHRHNVNGLSDTARDKYQRFARNIERKVVGPMPVDLFLEIFLPCRTRIPRFAGVMFSGVPDGPDKESAIYPSLRGALNEVLAKSNPALAFYGTSNRTESPGKVGSSKPGLGMFRKNDVNRGNLEDTHKCVKGAAPGEYLYTSRMGEVYTFIEVKTSDDPDPFTGPPNGDTTDVGKEHPNGGEARCIISALGQSASYAHVVQTRQFRTYVYSISVVGTTARLLRWDRSGVVVTEPFNYKASPEHLIGFVWRFSKATNEQRGFDHSAVAVTSEAEKRQFVDAIRKHVGEQLPGLSAEGIEEEVDRHFWPGTITRLTVGAGAEAHDVWVSRPIFTSDGPTGRSTIGYWGVECKSGKVVFVKDVWRTDVLGVETEGTVLRELLEAGVRNIPELVCHGDVIREGNVQTTQTDKFTEECWVKSLNQTEKFCRLTPRVHYRLVTKCAGFRLPTFKGTRELLSATFDAFTAVMDAHSKARTLHRDLSVGNIILYRVPDKPVRVGYLIDWELSCKVDKATVPDNVLMGTPAFMSIAASDTTASHVHNIKDDLESIIYIVLFCTLLWLPVESPVRDLDWWLTEFFSTPIGTNTGAPAKFLNAISRYHTEDLTSVTSQAVLDWLNSVMDLHFHSCPIGVRGIVGPNPAWDDGKDLEAMWMEMLGKALPDDDWCDNPIPSIVLREQHSLHTTNTGETTSVTLFDSHNIPLLQPSPATMETPAPAKRRRDSDQEGEVDTRGGKLRRIVVMPPPPVPGPFRQASRPLPTGGKTTKRSARQTANETRAASTATSKPTAGRFMARRSARKSSIK